MGLIYDSANDEKGLENAAIGWAYDGILFEFIEAKNAPINKS